MDSATTQNSGMFWYRIRFPLMAMGMLALLAGILSGLLRFGWDLPFSRSHLASIHGPLMISCFLGTVISLERSVAMGRPWSYLAPLCTGLGGLVLLSGKSEISAITLVCIGSVVLSAVYVSILRIQFTVFNVTMALGALAWFVGNIFWYLEFPVFDFVPWWVAFLILTIAGERLELSRFMAPSQSAYTAFLVAAGLFLSGVIYNTAGGGPRMAGAGMIAIALWLSRYDVARSTIRQAGLTKFVAVCLISGYVWLFASGIMAVSQSGLVPGRIYDAILHSLLLGFVFSMIFGHAPIIFPAVLRVAVPFRNAFYLHLILLHISIAMRLLADFADWESGRMIAGMLNALALIFFLANTVISVKKGLSLRTAR